MCTRLQQLRLRMAGKIITDASMTLLPTVQTELSKVVYDLSKRLEDGELTEAEKYATINQLADLRDDIISVIEVLEARKP